MAVKTVYTRGQNTDGSAVVLTMSFVDVPNKEMSVFFMLIWLYKPLHLAPCSRSHGNYPVSQAESDEIPRCAEKKLNECNVWARSGLSVCVCVAVVGFRESFMMFVYCCDPFMSVTSHACPWPVDDIDKQIRFLQRSSLHPISYRLARRSNYDAYVNDMDSIEFQLFIESAIDW